MKNVDVMIHPIADEMPMMHGEQYRSLLEDIRENGVKVPLLFLGRTTDDAVLIDGRNRLKAMTELGINWLDHWEMINPEELLTDDAIRAYVWSLNGARRHLPKGKLAIIAAKMMVSGVGRKKKTDESGTSRKAIAAKLGVSPTSANRAKKILKDGVPALVEAVNDGSIDVRTAEAVSDLPAEEQQAVAEAAPEEMKEVAKEALKKRDQRTVFDPASFDPAMKGGKTEKKLSPEKLAKEIDTLLAKAVGFTGQVKEALEISMRRIDEFNAESKVASFKNIEAKYRSSSRLITEGLADVILFHKAWKFKS